MVQVYQYLVFGALFLECENIQALFHVMPDNDSKVRAASVNLSNVENKYLQLFLANYPNGKSHFMVYDQNQQVQGDLPETKYFHQTDILKKQLDALYNHNVKGDLNCLYSVVSIMEKLKDSAKKKGFYL